MWIHMQGPLMDRGRRARERDWEQAVKEAGRECEEWPRGHQGAPGPALGRSPWWPKGLPVLSGGSPNKLQWAESEGKREKNYPIWESHGDGEEIWGKLKGQRNFALGKVTGQREEAKHEQSIIEHYIFMDENTSELGNEWALAKNRMNWH